MPIISGSVLSYSAPPYVEDSSITLGKCCASCYLEDLITLAQGFISVFICFFDKHSYSRMMPRILRSRIEEYNQLKRYLNSFGEGNLQIPILKNVKKTCRHILVNICALKYMSSNSLYFRVISTTRQEFFSC